MNTSEQGKSRNEQNNSYFAHLEGGCRQGCWWPGRWRPIMGHACKYFIYLHVLDTNEDDGNGLTDTSNYGQSIVLIFLMVVYIYIKIVSILIIKEGVVGDGVPAIHQS
jgi:hypothetical protein